MQPKDMTLNGLVSYVGEMKKQRGFDGTTIEQEMVLFTEEVGELAREVWQLARASKAAENQRRDLAYEVVDCLIYLLSIARMAGAEDMERYLLEKEAINTKRFE